MKRALSTILALLLLIALIGCGGTPFAKPETTKEPIGENPSDAAAQPEATKVPEATAEPIEPEESEEPEEPEESEEPAEPEVPDDSEAFDKTATVEETVLFDDQGIKITLNGLEFTPYDSIKLPLTIENTNDFDVTVTSGSIGSDINAINGYMVGGYLYSSVSAGKKALEEMTLQIGQLEMYGIKGISEIQLAFEVKKSDHSTLLNTGAITVRTSLENANDIGFCDAITNTSFQNRYGISVQELHANAPLESELAELKSVTIMYNEDGEQAFCIELENISDKSYNVEIRDTVINGILIWEGQYTRKTVTPGKRCVVEAEFMNMTGDDNVYQLLGFDTITSIDMLIAFTDQEYHEVGKQQQLIIKLEETDINAAAEAKSVYSDGETEILFRGVVNDASSYSDDKYIVLFVKNLTEEDRRFEIKYNSVSINDFMANTYNNDGIIKADGISLVVLELMDPEKIQISKSEDNKTVEFAYEVLQLNYHKISEGTVSITVAE